MKTAVVLMAYGSPSEIADIPAYLADTFGTQYVGAIHGRLLTAWSTAGIIGPVLVNYIREAELAAGVPRQQVYDFTMYILAGLLLFGLIANAFVKSRIPSPKPQIPSHTHITRPVAARVGIWNLGFGSWDLLFSWTAIGLPLAWGTWVTLGQALVLFSGGR